MLAERGGWSTGARGADVDLIAEAASLHGAAPEYLYLERFLKVEFPDLHSGFFRSQATCSRALKRLFARDDAVPAEQRCDGQTIILQCSSNTLCWRFLTLKHHSRIALSANAPWE